MPCECPLAIYRIELSAVACAEQRISERSRLRQDNASHPIEFLCCGTQVNYLREAQHVVH